MFAQVLLIIILKSFPYNTDSGFLDLYITISRSVCCLSMGIFQRLRLLYIFCSAIEITKSIILNDCGVISGKCHVNRLGLKGLLFFFIRIMFSIIFQVIVNIEWFFKGLRLLAPLLLIINADLYDKCATQFCSFMKIQLTSICT